MVEIVWTTDLIGQLATATEEAKAKSVVTFNFQGQEMAVDYAEAVLEYLTEALAHPTIQ